MTSAGSPCSHTLTVSVCGVFFAMHMYMVSIGSLLVCVHSLCAGGCIDTPPHTYPCSWLLYGLPAHKCSWFLGLSARVCSVSGRRHWMFEVVAYLSSAAPGIAKSFFGRFQTFTAVIRGSQSIDSLLLHVLTKSQSWQTYSVPIWCGTGRDTPVCLYSMDCSGF